MKVQLLSPKGFRKLTRLERKKYCNGCGSLWGGLLVPDTIYGLYIGEACNIHDYMYSFGRTLEDKDLADELFHLNLLKLINENSGNKFMIWLRIKRADKYYWAVKNFGEEAFFKGGQKNG